MSNKTFSELEIDALGEISNISLGSSATAISNMLDHRVDITTPSVSVVNAEDFELGNMEPAVGVEIKYVTGLEGSNIMLLKMSDIKVIVDILLGMETPDDEFVLDDLSLSAACEVMNQMMGAAATALSDFLGRVVNISTPQTFDLDDMEAFKRERLPVQKGPIVVVRFALDIEPSLKSEFMNVMSVELARELLGGFGLGSTESEPETVSVPEPEPEVAAEIESHRSLSQEEIEKMMASGGEAAPAPAPAASSGGGGASLSQEEIEKLMAGAAATPAPAPAPAAPSGGGASLSQEEIEKLMAGAAATPAPAPAPAAPSGGGASLSQEEIEKLMAGGAPPGMPAMPQGMPAMPQGMPGMPGMPMQPQAGPGNTQYIYVPMYYPQPPAPAAPPQPEPKVIAAKSPEMPKLAGVDQLGQEQAENLDLIMGVPLEVTVEIGRTRKKVQDILSFAKGSLVILDKLAGDQVDLFVNGKCIARGEVVVIDDNFGIRIGEILRKPELEDFTK